MKERVEGKENPREIERLEEAHISVFGQGHFGRPLTERLKQISPPTLRVDAVGGAKGAERDMLNIDAARRSKLLILATRPDQVAPTLRGVRDYVQIEAQVLSFAANTSSERNLSTEMLARASGRPAARGMADTHFNISAFVLGEKFSTRGYEFIFEKLSRLKPLVLKNDAALDRYSIMLSHLLVALLMERAGEIRSAEPHAHFLSAQKEFPYDLKDLLSFSLSDDAEGSLKEVATPGGISERFRNALLKKPDMKPADLLLMVAESLKH